MSAPKNPWLLTVILMCGLFITPGAHAEDKATAKPKVEKVSWCIYVNNAPNPVRAFGFDIIYPTDALVFDGVSRGELLEKGFRFFGSNELRPGRIRIGGMEPGKGVIGSGASGRLVTLTFVKKKKIVKPAFKFLMVRDDMQAWSLSVKGDKNATLSLGKCEK